MRKRGKNKRHNLEEKDGRKILRKKVKRFRGGLVFKAPRRAYHSTLGSRVMEKKKMGNRSRARGCIDASAVPTETKVESGTSQSKRKTSVDVRVQTQKGSKSGQSKRK